MVPSLTIAITTAPRPVCYLGATLEALDAASDRLSVRPDVHIFAEPGAVLPVGSDRPRAFHLNSERRGNWHNWRQAAKFLVEETDSQLLMTMEDDVLLAQSALVRVVDASRRPRHEGFGYFSLYVSGHHQRALPPPGREPEPVLKSFQRVWGACAWVFSRESLMRTLDHPIAAVWTGEKNVTNDPQLANGVDIAVGMILQDLGLPTYYFHPATAQHIGEHSTVGNDEGLTNHRRAAAAIDY